MMLNELISVIKNEFPEKAIDLSESLTLLRETINDLMEAMSNKMSMAFSKRDFQCSEKYYQLGKAINEYESKIDEIIDMLEFENEDTVMEENDGDEETEKRNIPDYSQYLVDSNVEHTLYENFTHIRPYGFRINNGELNEVRTWQEMLLKTCETLIKMDSQKFLGFENSKSMNGKKNKYFSMNPDDMRKPVMVAGKVYVETNMSGNAIRNLILKMLKEYGFKASDYKVYFRADYTDINTK